MITLPSVAYSYWNSLKQVTDGCEEREAKALERTAAKIAADPMKQTKTYELELPEGRPAKCPATTPLPPTLNNHHFDGRLSDDFSLKPKVKRYGLQWKRSNQTREHIYFFVTFYVSIDGTEEDVRGKEKSVDELTSVFNGKLQFHSEEDDGGVQQMES